MSAIRSARLSYALLYISILVYLAFGAILLSCGGGDNNPTSPQTEAKFVGPTAPDFVLKDMDGNNVKLADFRGKVVILNFWATWCPPCVEEIPYFIELYQNYKEHGLVIVGISVDQGGPEVVREFAAEYNVNYPLVMATQQVVSDYGDIQSIPTTFIIDREGRVVDVAVGTCPKSYFENKISNLF